MSENWGYSSTNGPDTWFKSFPDAAGKRQSPVDINSDDAQCKTFCQPLTWTYQLEDTRNITNTGHSWRVDARDGESELSGGPLENTFYLKQLHSHWGPTDDTGSEHTVDGKYYAGELHLVHWNSKYDTFEEAVKYPDGLCVFGIFLQVGSHNTEFEEIINTFDDIKFKGDKSKITGPLNLEALIPKDSCYWTYLGSLTTPPCSECVIWIVFQNPIQISSMQLEKFRCLKNKEEPECNDDSCMVTNYRPTLPLYHRKVKLIV